MKIRICILLLFCLLLTGCSSVQTFETLGPVAHQPGELAAPAAVHISLPESATAEVFGSGEDTLYDCQGYSVVVQTFSSGDFRSTMQRLSGFSPEKVTVMESQTGGVKRYDWVWTAAGEEGALICRAMVLDDGNYHYCLSAIAPAQQAGTMAEEWNQLFGSFSLGKS